MHMYKLRLRAIIGAFNKKQCINLTFKSGGWGAREFPRQDEYFPCPNTTLFGQITGWSAARIPKEQARGIHEENESTDHLPDWQTLRLPAHHECC